LTPRAGAAHNARVEPTPAAGPAAGQTVFSHQRVVDLVYRLCRGAVDLQAMTVLERREVSLAPGLEAALVVLGASHAVELRWAGERATEILACAAVPRGVDVVAEVAPAAEVERRFELPGLSLAWRLRIVPDDEAQRERVRRTLAAASFAARGVAVRFPPGRGVAGGLTLVVAREGAPVVETIHSYPAEGMLVLTETRCGR
jgi:hypothetical protein